jgi:hypothetical protein
MATPLKHDQPAILGRPDFGSEAQTRDTATKQLNERVLRESDCVGLTNN